MLNNLKQKFLRQYIPLYSSKKHPVRMMLKYLLSRKKSIYITGKEQQTVKGVSNKMEFLQMSLYSIVPNAFRRNSKKLR